VNSGKKVQILILSTGGTIEKTYDEVEGSLENRETAIKERILNELRYPHHEFSIKVIMQKDSLDMDEQDRLIIFDAIQSFQKLNTPMIILHGTDTMDQTLEFCEDALKSRELKLSVPVVFTGAMRPLGFVDSDAKQNVIESISAASLLLPGFYLNFHGKLFEPKCFIKNKKQKTFELKDKL